MPFIFEETPLDGVILVRPKILKDSRGFFIEEYKKSDFSKAGIDVDFLQDNHSKSTKGVLRGLHFQKKPYEQAKLVRCIKGEILDVAVDIRLNSKNFGKHFSAILSEENCNMLFIPEGFLHGFLTLSEYAEIFYKCSREYNPKYDAGIRYDDPDINISWGLSNPSLSEKDKKLPFLKDIKEDL
jgi:dTDP-4-dehydrorhamnose 3,5-epimerase